MNLDWIVAIVTFVLLTVFSFNYYTAFFVHQADLDNMAVIINQRVMDSVSTGGYTVPVYYNSTGAQGGKILYMDLMWPQGTRDSAKIMLGGVEQPCMLDNDRIYWQSNLADGDNVFQLVMSNINVPVSCNDVLTIIDEDRATPWSMSKQDVLSQEKISLVSSMDYGRYRNSISVSRDIRIELDNGFSYGPLPPRNIDVFVFEKNTTIAETSEKVNMKVFVW